jgi:hypothetical protein
MRCLIGEKHITFESGEIFEYVRAEIEVACPLSKCEMINSHTSCIKTLVFFSFYYRIFQCGFDSPPGVQEFSLVK